MLRRVVGFVLAAMLLNVRGSERYEEDDREGDGEGGALGGIGRTEASSSASNAVVGDHTDSDRSEAPSSSSVSAENSRTSSSPFNETVFRLAAARASSFPCCLPPLIAGEGNGVEATRVVVRRGIGPPRPFPRPTSVGCCCALLARFVLTVPANLR